MSELSKQAQILELALKTAVNNDGAEFEPSFYLDVAKAALELAGEEVAHDDSSGIREYKIKAAEIYALTYGSIAVRINDAQALTAAEATELAYALLHAAATAGEERRET